MSDRRLVWATLANLLARLEDGLLANAPNGLEALTQEIRKLGKIQFRANTLAEEQSSRQAAAWEKALSQLDTAQTTQVALVEQLIAERLMTERQRWLESIIPALDGLDHAILSGQQYLESPDIGIRHNGVPDFTVLHAATDSITAGNPVANAYTQLASWVSGLRLVRERLLAILEAGGVMPIPTIGYNFDPYQHVAVATTDTVNKNMPAPAPGIIVAEERRGYRTAAGVLRYADVIVYRPQGS
ncbi:MAG: nucleotide exchange factor GrpE [Anaerolineae bacterium]|nr:nucleotide exchange factor GrpE [Anaerolineae bacterium]